MKKQKQTNYDNGANALNFVESLESNCAQLESWCEEQIVRYSGQFWPKDFAAEQIKPVLLANIRWCERERINTMSKSNLENFAWHVAFAKFARRLASRYEIEIN